MKIECKIKRADGTVVDMPNGDGEKPTRYHFKPLDPRDSDSPHVAEVSAKHASRFFRADAEVYVPYESAPPPVLQPPAPPAPVVPPPPATPAAAQSSDPATPPVVPPPGDEDEDEDPPGERMTLPALRAGIGSKELTPEKLRELLEQEQQADKPRQAFINTIVKALK